MEKIVSRAKENRDLTKGNLIRKIFIYLIPLFLANVLQLLFTTMDLFTVTHFGEGNLSSGAIGATNNLINLILCVFWGITSGASVVIANAKGAKDYEKITKAIGSSVLIMIIASIVVLFFGLSTARPLLVLIDTREEFIEKSTLYLTVFFLGTPFNLLYNMGASILRAFGDTRRPFVAVLISGIINVSLNFALVSSLDVLGVAIATISSQAVAMVIVFIFLIKDKRLAGNFYFRHLKIYKEESLDILRLGLTSGLQAFIFNFTNVNVQKCVNELGSAAVIGKAAASNIEGYEYALLNSISQTCLVSCSQNYGAKDKNRIKKSLLITVLMELILVTLFNGIILILNKPLLGIFIAQGEPTTEMALEFGLSSLFILGLPYAACGISECFANYLRGMKYAIAPTLVSLACIVGLRMIFITFIFNQSAFHNYEALMSIYPISWVLCHIVYAPVLFIITKKAFRKIDNSNLI